MKIKTQQDQIRGIVALMYDKPKNKEILGKALGKLLEMLIDISAPDVDYKYILTRRPSNENY